MVVMVVLVEILKIYQLIIANLAKFKISKSTKSTKFDILKANFVKVNSSETGFFTSKNQKDFSTSMKGFYQSSNF